VSEFAARLDEAKLTVALDLRHPFAFLALRPARELGRELGIEINWLPISAQPLRPPPAAQPGDDRGTRHKSHRAQMIAREIAIYADAQQRTVLEPYRAGPATAAHLAWLWLRARAPHALDEFLEELFRRYWSLELDADDLGAAARLVGACGGSTSDFEKWAADDGPQAAAALDEELADAGLFQTPAYLVEDEVFYGRQHLPMIRWILTDRRGPIPI
jgi:2-hydroxychromene-2-carboxylate isomerase